MKSKYNSLTEWKGDKPNVYHLASSKGLLSDICNVFGWELTEKYKSCDIEEILKTTIGYTKYSDWRCNEQKWYRLSVRFNLTKELCERMGWNKRLSNGYWTKERCIEEALKYKSQGEWRLGSSGSQSSAQNNGWIEECSKHMKGRFNKLYWTKERCIEEALKYDTRKEWRTLSKGSWSAAMRLECYEECTKHMLIIKTWKNKK